MIIKIAGTNGSGKTSLVRALMSLGVFAPVVSASGKRIEEYVCHSIPGIPFKVVRVLGSYQNVCGGMDTISDKFEIRRMVKRHTNRPQELTIFEGLITGKTYGELGSYSDMDSEPWIYAFMDTPFEVCVERVAKRRAERGNDAPFDPERTMRPTYKSCQSVEARVRGAGAHPVYLVSHRLKPTTSARKLLEFAAALSKQRKGGRK